MCREAIPLACRFRQREELPEGIGIAQLIYLQFLRSCYEINYTDCAGWFFEIKEENAAVPGYGEAF